MEFLPKEQCQKVLYLCIILLHDINYIIVLSYGFHIMFNMFNKQDCKNGNTNKPTDKGLKSVGERDPAH